MLRFWLLGGHRPTVPWQLFLTLGGGLLAAGVLFALLFPLWSTYAWAGVAEVAVFLIASTALLTIGAVRRQRAVREERAQRDHPRMRPLS
jgi:membrane protein implicated in regulation of membrane protease activity